MTIQCQIENRLSKSFKSDYIEVINESFMHQVDKGAESHFKVVIVSEIFVGKALVERHRLVQSVLSEEIKKIHALSLIIKTPQEWQKENKYIRESPSCQHK